MRLATRRRLIAAGFWACLGALAVPLFLWNRAQGSPAQGALGVLVAAGAVAAGFAVLGLWRARREARLGQGAELLNVWRARLSARLQMLRGARLFLAAMGAWNLLVAGIDTGNGQGFPMAAASVGMIALAAAAFAHFVKLPVVRRELAELDRSGEA
jgi:hypothetical protein